MSSHLSGSSTPSGRRPIAGYLAAAFSGALLVLLGMYARPLVEREKEPAVKAVPIADEDHFERLLEVEALAPPDLGITKRRFLQRPLAGEVAIFRTTVRDRLKPANDKTSDSIQWTGGGETRAEIVIVPLSFYREEGPYSPDAHYRQSWRVMAGGEVHPVEGYGLVDSTWSDGKEVTGRIVFSKGLDGTRKPPEDLVFEVQSFVVTLEEAKKLHPELDIQRDPGVTSWSGRFDFDRVLPPSAAEPVED